MPQQQINLYRYFEKPVTDSEFLTWKRYWASNILFACLMVVALIFSVGENFFLKKRLQTSQTEMTKYKEEFQQMKGSFPQFFFGENINDAVAMLNKEMAAQKKIIDILSMHDAFSQNLISLSRTIVPNVWLTTISIEKNGRDITLIGKSIGMKNLQDFIARLNKDKIYGPYITALKKVSNENVNDPETKLTFELSMVRNSNG